jgi:hypothetical protein
MLLGEQHSRATPASIPASFPEIVQLAGYGDE